MKIRIKGNSIRIRLTRSEVARLSEQGIVRESTRFPDGVFSYEVILSKENKVLDAVFSENCIRFRLPENSGRHWPDDDRIGFEEWMPLGKDSTLHLLLEKDFQCLELRSEDESDQYPNPKATL
jgi:hypothetical protein